MFNVELLRSRAGEAEFTAGQALMRRMLAREVRRSREECTYLVVGEGRHQVKVTSDGAQCDCGQRHCRHGVAAVLTAVESGAMQEMESYRAYLSAPALMDAVAGMLPESDGVKLVPVLFLCQDGVRIALPVGDSQKGYSILVRNVFDNDYTKEHKLEDAFKGGKYAVLSGKMAKDKTVRIIYLAGSDGTHKNILIDLYAK